MTGPRGETWDGARTAGKRQGPRWKLAHCYICQEGASWGWWGAMQGQDVYYCGACNTLHLVDHQDAAVRVYIFYGASKDGEWVRSQK